MRQLLAVLAMAVAVGCAGGGVTGPSEVPAAPTPPLATVVLADAQLATAKQLIQSSGHLDCYKGPVEVLWPYTVSGGTVQLAEYDVRIVSDNGEIAIRKTGPTLLEDTTRVPGVYAWRWSIEVLTVCHPSKVFISATYKRFSDGSPISVEATKRIEVTQ